MNSLSLLPKDLAPGDERSRTLESGALVVRTVEEGADFERAYAILLQEFGAAGELEQPEILQRRLRWAGARGEDGWTMRYDLVVVENGGEIMAVRDHTAIVDDSLAVVHLSHAWVMPTWRRTGLAGWLRALPVQTARACLGLPEAISITLVAEMEYPDGHDSMRDIRLRAYERAGFLKIDPEAVRYEQPDFRTPNVIDAVGESRALPFQLVVRRVGREGQRVIPGAEVREIVRRLYAMYARDLRPSEMEPLMAKMSLYPEANAQVQLVSPTE